MSDDTPEPLEPELRALFDAEARFPEAPSAMRARVLARLPLDVPPVPPVPPGTGLLTLAKAAALFVAGGVAGAGLYAALVPPPPPRIVQVQTPAPAPTPVVIQLPPTPPVTVPEPVARPAKKREREPAPEPLPSQLARERAIIDAARTALAQGHVAEARLALARHGSEFPDGALAEEREGLSVLGLVRAGRADDARKAAAAFRKRYPASVLGPAIDAAVSTLR